MQNFRKINNKNTVGVSGSIKGGHGGIINQVGNNLLSDDETGRPSYQLPANQKICKTEVCREAGKSLYESINFEADPCDDFFDYSCGRWVKEHPIPEDKSRIGTFQMLDDSLNERLRLILEKENIGGRTQTENVNSGGQAKSVQFALDLYKECMNRGKINI